MLSAHPSPAAPRTAPLTLWRIAETFLHVLYNIFGAPEDVARQHTLTRAPYLLLREWLRAGEAVMRKLLLIEAAALDVPPSPRAARKASKRQRRVMSFDHDKPEKWRVGFSCSPSSPARGGSAERRRREAKGQAAPSDRSAISAPARGRDAPSFYAAWPLAERYEALIRVFNDPAPFARRLAARLRARPAAARAVLAHPASAAALIGHVAFDTLCIAGEESRCAIWPERPALLLDTS